MVTVSLRLRGASLRKAFEPVQRRAAAPFGGQSGKRAVAIMRSAVRQEFSGGYWLSPAGGRIPWPRTHDFGRQKASPRPLRRTGAYFASLMGGAGSIERITPNQIVLGAVSRYGPIHRGGEGANIRTSPVTIRPRKLAASRGRRRRSQYAQRFAMFWRLLGDHGVPLRAETLRKGLKLPRRPHMTRNPETTRKIARSVERYVATGRAA
jgi:hypothetical protein